MEVYGSVSVNPEVVYVKSPSVRVNVVLHSGPCPSDV